jgi:micrococcal nuclease
LKTSVRPAFRFISVCLLAALVHRSAGGTETAPPGTPVYVGKSGRKYHRFECRTLQSKKYRMDLAAAERAGYEPCLTCRPTDGRALSDELVSETPNGALYRVNVEKLTSYRQASLQKMLRGRVSRHIDGDTVHITLENPPRGFSRIEKIRMIGVDTPETVHPSRDVEYFGLEASNFTKNALLDKVVCIALDWDTRDRYGRLLAYIYTPDGGCHNAELIRRGYAHAYTRFPFQFLEEFRFLEQEARAAKTGLWGL